MVYGALIAHAAINSRKISYDLCHTSDKLRRTEYAYSRPMVLIIHPNAFDCVIVHVELYVSELPNAVSPTEGAHGIVGNISSIPVQRCRA